MGQLDRFLCTTYKNFRIDLKLLRKMSLSNEENISVKKISGVSETPVPTKLSLKMDEPFKRSSMRDSKFLEYEGEGAEEILPIPAYEPVKHEEISHPEPEKPAVVAYIEPMSSEVTKFKQYLDKHKVPETFSRILANMYKLDYKPHNIRRYVYEELTGIRLSPELKKLALQKDRILDRIEKLYCDIQFMSFDMGDPSFAPGDDYWVFTGKDPRAPKIRAESTYSTESTGDELSDTEFQGENLEYFGTGSEAGSYKSSNLGRTM